MVFRNKVRKLAIVFRMMMNIRCRYSIIHGMEIQNLITESITTGIIVLFRTGIRTFQNSTQQVIIIFSSPPKFQVLIRLLL